jgi:hypothetical protein
VVPDSETLPAEVVQWINDLGRSPWNDDVAQAPFGEYPLDPAVQVAPRRWKRWTTRYDAQAVVYELSSAGQGLAVAFCIRTGRAPSALPTVPGVACLSNTGGMAIGAWQRDGMVYILAVQGGARRYRAFVESGMVVG